MNLIKLVASLMLFTGIARANTLQQLDLYTSSAQYRVTGRIGVAASTTTSTSLTTLMDGVIGISSVKPIATSSNITGAYFFGNGSTLTGIIPSSATYWNTAYSSAIAAYGWGDHALGGYANLVAVGTATGTLRADLTTLAFSMGTATGTLRADLTTLAFSTGTLLPKSGGTMTGSIDVNGYALTNVGVVYSNAYYGDQGTNPKPAISMQGDVVSTGSITAIKFHGDGSPLTGIIQSSATGTYPLSISGNASSATYAVTTSSDVYWNAKQATGLTVLKAGDTMTGALTMSGSSITIVSPDSDYTPLLLNSGPSHAMYIDLQDDGASKWKLWKDASSGFRLTDSDNSRDKVVVYPGNIAVAPLTIAANGRVGISTDVPTAALAVTGGIIASSSITAQGGFYGNGANLTGVITSSVPYVALAGDTMTDSLVVVGSVTAAYFNGDGSLLSNLPAGGVTVSTFTVDLHSGGDVYIASGTISANMGMAYVFDSATATITGVRCYTLVASSVATTSFNIMVSTDIGASTGVGNYLFTSSVTVTTNASYRSVYSPWSVPDTTFGSQGVVPMAISLQVIAVPASGTLPSEYGCIIRYWRRLD